MSSFVVKNNVESLVTNDPLAQAATTLNVTGGDGASFPSTFPFLITIWDDDIYPDPTDDSGMEIVKCTGRTTDALTIVRGQEGTGDVAHALAERVAMLITAGIFNDATYGVSTKLDGMTAGAIADIVEDTTPQLGGTLDSNSKQVRWSKGSDVASANGLTLGDDGNYFDITGTTAITSIVTKAIGTVAILHFDGILTLTHNATDLILPGGADITTAAGDEAMFVEYASADWRCVSYTKASGAAVVSSGIPSGLISMWHGLLANIPAGWVLCDGTNSTPDLRDKFTRGAAAAANPGTTGGSDTHTLITSEMPAHTHSYSHLKEMSGSIGQSGGGMSTYGYTTGSTGGGGAHNNIPAYYAVAYIMKT